jgi:DNA-binding NarL/FixJ family response regulator
MTEDFSPSESISDPNNRDDRAYICCQSCTDIQLVIISNSSILGECMRIAFDAAMKFNIVRSYRSIEIWRKEFREDAGEVLLILCFEGRSIEDSGFKTSIRLLMEWRKRISVVILADDSNADQVIQALDAGARGYLSADISFGVAVQALHLVRAGGIFVPAGSLSSVRAVTSKPPEQTDRVEDNRRIEGLFTSRQADVAMRLCEGKANKVIAYELKMREATVKVHIRNIMRKLKARNRTEVAIRVNALLHKQTSHGREFAESSGAIRSHPAPHTQVPVSDAGRSH